MTAFHPDLQAARYIPRYTMGPRLTRLMRSGELDCPPVPDDVIVEDVAVPGSDGEPQVSLRIYQPRELASPAPALFWTHGGGFIQGSPSQDEVANIAFARELGITVVAAQYRLAPEHPFPAAIDDLYAGLTWLFDEAEARGIDPTRIAIGGASAGAGLTAALALVAHDRDEVRPAFQLLVYPMLDDRTVLRTDIDHRAAHVVAGQ